MTGAVLSIYDRSGIALKPWAEAGYQCFAVDLVHESDSTECHPSGGSITRLKRDARRFRPDCKRDWVMAFAWPPRTHLSISGARWFAGKGLFALADSIDLVAHGREIVEATGARYLIEQPMSTLSTYWRSPDYRFNPCDYGLFLDPPGDAYTKETWLWVGNGFLMPDVAPVEPVEGSKMHRLAPSPDRAAVRSATPEGFARAVFDANSELGAAA